MHWILSLTGTSVTSGGNALALIIPGGAKNVNGAYYGSFTYSDNGTYGQGIVAGSGNIFLLLYKNLAAPNWTASTGNTAIVLNIEFEIQ